MFISTLFESNILRKVPIDSIGLFVGGLAKISSLLMKTEAVYLKFILNILNITDAIFGVKNTL